MKTPSVLAAVLLLLSASAARCKETGSCTIQPSNGQMIDITLEVRDKINHRPLKTYQTQVKKFGFLIGGLIRLQAGNCGFKFTYTVDPDFGPFLQSVNKIKGNSQSKTYWELLSQKGNLPLTPLNVGMGCYQPQQHEKILLNFTTY